MTERDDGEREVEIEIETDDDGRVPPSASGGGDDSVSERRLEDAPERRLEDELGRIDLLTTPEGYVEGRVSGLSERDGTTVTLEVTLPHDAVVEFDLEKPIPWSREFLLARIVEDVGYDASSIGHVIGEIVYVARTDAGPTAEERSEEWWTNALETAGNAVLSAAGDRYRLAEERDPEWRLVDPLERSTTDEDDSGRALERIGAALAVLGAALAAAGATVGATGGLVLSASVLGYAFPGLVLTLIGLYVLLAGDISRQS